VWLLLLQCSISAGALRREKDVSPNGKRGVNNGGEGGGGGRFYFGCLHLCQVCTLSARGIDERCSEISVTCIGRRWMKWKLTKISMVELTHGAGVSMPAAQGGRKGEA